MGSIMGSQYITDSDYGSNISVFVRQCSSILPGKKPASNYCFTTGYIVFAGVDVIKPHCNISCRNSEKDKKIRRERERIHFTLIF